MGHNIVYSFIHCIDAPRKSHGKLPFLSELLSSRRRRRQAATQDHAPPTELVPSPIDELDRPLNAEPVITGIKVGNLSKSSQSRRDAAVPGPSRLRRFRLTEEALEYFQQFSHVSVCMFGVITTLLFTTNYICFVILPQHQRLLSLSHCPLDPWQRSGSMPAYSSTG